MLCSAKLLYEHFRPWFELGGKYEKGGIIAQAYSIFVALLHSGSSCYFSGL